MSVERTVAAPKKTDKRTVKRKRILDTASELFFERGYAGTTMDAICDALKVTKPYVYWYFSDKTEILDTISLEAADQTLGALKIGARGHDTAIERLIAGITAMMMSHVRLFKAGSLYYRETGALSDEGRAKMEAHARRFHRSLVKMIEECVAEGALPAQDAKLTALAMGGIAGFMYTWYRPKGPLSPDEMAEHLTELMMNTAGYSPRRSTKRTRS